MECFKHSILIILNRVRNKIPKLIKKQLYLIINNAIISVNGILLGGD
jgi:hypothetical protein